MKRLAVASIVLGVLALAALWWIAFRTTSMPVLVSQTQPPAAAPKQAEGKGASAVVGIPGATPYAPSTLGSRYSPASLALRDRIAASLNLRALYEELRGASDPGGEISYRLAEAIFECTPFIDRSPEDIGKRLSATQPPPDIPRRKELIAWMAQRCAGFSAMGSSFAQIYQDLHKRAEAAGYPAEIARSLRQEPDREKADGIAIRLLSSNPDADVVHEIQQYIDARNGAGWTSRPNGADAQVWAYGWGLLECSYGADCGPASRPIVMTCIVMAICGPPSMEETILAQTRSPRTLQQAAILRGALDGAIQQRDWARIGLIPLNKSP